MNEPKVISQEEVISRLDTIIAESINELEFDIIPSLSHGEAKRLFIATLKYPREDVGFPDDLNRNMARGYAAATRLKDALVSMGVEVVIDQLTHREREAQLKMKGEEVKGV